jgi:branched-chain amino acid transport system substrate-binding protein
MKKRLKLIMMMALSSMVVMSVVGCSNQKADGQSGKAPDKIKIGAVLPLTGKESKIGTFFKAAYEFAVKEVNDQGGIMLKEYNKKVPIELTIQDDQTDQTKSVSLFERLATIDKVDAVLGGYSTPLIMAQSIVPEKYHIPYVNGGGASSSIYQRNMKYVFGTMAPVEELGVTTMDVLKEQMDSGKLTKPAKLVVLWENTDHGKEYLDGIKQWVVKNPGYAQIAMSEGFELYGSDYSSLLTKVKNANGTIFLVDAHLPDYILMHRQYTEMGLKHEMVSYGARGPDKDAKEALGKSTDYVFAGVWWDKSLPYPQVKEFVKNFESFTESQGKKMSAEWYAAISYEAARALIKAIENAGSLDKTKVRDALANLTLEKSILPGQTLKFGPEGQAHYPYVIVQNKPGGKNEIVHPKDSKTGDIVAPIPR